MFRLDLGRYSTKGGFLSPTLASILYQTALGDFVYQTDSNGNVVLDNQGTLTSAYDGLPYSGRGIELGATNDVDIPIHHTLGAEEVTNSTFDTDVSNWTADSCSIAHDALGGGSAKITADVRARLLMYPSDALTVGNTYLITFDAYRTVDQDFAYWNGTDYVALASGSVLNDWETITVEITASTTTFSFGQNLGLIVSTDVLYIDNVSIKQITNQNSYLTYYDFTDGLVTLGNSIDGGSSDNLELLNDNGYDDATSWTIDTTISISGGVCTYANSPLNYTARDTSLNNQIIAGKTYLVSFDIVSIESGGFILRLYNGVSSVGDSSTYTTVGTKTQIITALGNGDGIGIASSVSTTSGIVDNISVKEILPISTKYTLNTKTINNVLTHTTNWSALDWTKINNNPNYIGKLALETTGATKTIPELDMELDQGASADSYYMCSENSGAYLVDSRVAYGAELVTNGTFDTDISSWTKTGDAATTITWSSGKLLVDAATVLDGATQTISTEINSIYVAICDIELLTSLSARIYAQTTNVFTETSKNDEIAIIFKAVSTSEIIRVDSYTGTGTFTADNISVRKATATEIANYAETIRTNADLQQKGIQQIAFVTDGAGVPTSYSDNLLQFNGDGRYVDTGWVPSASEDWSIEYVAYAASTTSSTLQQGSGTFSSIGVNSIVYINRGLSTTNMTIRAFDISAGVSPVLDSLNHYSITYNAVNKTVGVYLNGLPITELVSTAQLQPTDTFLVGAVNISGTPSRHLETPSGLFKIHKNKAFDATEVATAYAQAKAIYPSLP